MNKYMNRRDAGKILAKALIPYQNNKDVIVLALPRGGVPVAYEIAHALHAPLDVFIVRKLGVPGYRELAMGAIAPGDVTLYNQDIIQNLQVTPVEMQAVIAAEKAELHRREKAYRGERPFPSLKDKIVILVDDGIATGASMKVAIQAVKATHPQKIIAAVPVADVEIAQVFQKLVDEFVCPMIVSQLQAVGMWYNDFSQTEDDEVHELLKIHE